MEVNRCRNVAEINKDISDRLLDSLYMLEILEEIAESNAKVGILITKNKEYVREAFDDIEECRSLIYIAD